MRYILSMSSQKGSALIIILIAVALFGAITYAFMQSSKGNITWLQTEGAKANSQNTTQCQNNLDAATKRLEARGCGALISTATDGSNANVGAPTDGSCSVYHPNGGGIKPCGGNIY